MVTGAEARAAAASAGRSIGAVTTSCATAAAGPIGAPGMGPAAREGAVAAVANASTCRRDITGQRGGMSSSST
jgi:hypothetical protein